jgi:hypothetical protein
LSKLNKDIQANQGPKGGGSQIFQIRFLLAYMELVEGRKFDPIIFRILNSDLLLFLLFSS